ncbi:hypothetical protein CVD25_20380 [Bacillus canaveralius]|uniref:Uncharacterized protein n=1 Tax=Bacillus canaveralius TaxID=1403243 RepID=A0A2N5GJK2_9BACI|nr:MULTISPECIES: hypothetical protein [Bacillus]PLR80709.1 hypothetical protein CVD23_20480 [Bacillus sp. V33-4]PLR81416.1 hypothetical protein CU635_15145 [Bacillus canaveralius]PLR90045.1 hypothetical protein CVD25_20380 [Bacillus canaveralius]RSK53077.1 hypothetical protein EJA13_09370 [Bacillus canaveralius]
MKIEVERALRVKSLSNDILEQLLEDRISFKEKDLRNAVELLARSVQDLTNLYVGVEEDHVSTLKATIMKMKICHNTLYYGKSKESLENENASLKKF